ncbi:MAG: hypothetical protein ABUL72_02850, partial [Armatimonadota bacterium]
PHQPIMNANSMKRASQDRYIAAVLTTDPRLKPLEDDHGHQSWDSEQAESLEKFMHDLDPISVERVMTSEGY